MGQWLPWGEEARWVEDAPAPAPAAVPPLLKGLRTLAADLADTRITLAAPAPVPAATPAATGPLWSMFSTVRLPDGISPLTQQAADWVNAHKGAAPSATAYWVDAGLVDELVGEAQVPSGRAEAVGGFWNERGSGGWLSDLVDGLKGALESPAGAAIVAMVSAGLGNAATAAADSIASSVTDAALPSIADTAAAWSAPVFEVPADIAAQVSAAASAAPAAVAAPSWIESAHLPTVADTVAAWPPVDLAPLAQVPADVAAAVEAALPLVAPSVPVLTAPPSVSPTAALEGFTVAGPDLAALSVVPADLSAQVAAAAAAAAAPALGSTIGSTIATRAGNAAVNAAIGQALAAMAPAAAVPRAATVPRAGASTTTAGTAAPTRNPLGLLLLAALALVH